MITLRRAVAADAQACASILHEAFVGIATQHGFPSSFPSIEVAGRVAEHFLRIPAIHSLVAETGGRVAGVVFLDEGDPIAGVAAIAVDPALQGQGIGRRLMRAALERARGAVGVRLVQEAYNTGALALYASLGFEAKEPLARMAGTPRCAPPTGVDVRPFGLERLEECARLHERVHGFDRSVDLRDGIGFFRPLAAVRGGRVVAFTYAVYAGSLAWGVAETEEDLRALLAGVAAALRAPLAFLVPTRQVGLFRWCLDEGLRVEKPLTLMAMGEYREPQGGWFPSGIY
jgi:ribosomal protein S18 acetylase RimI-like enzyme